MDDDFLDNDVKYIPPDVIIEDGEIEDVTPAGNPMQKLESNSIKQQVDNLLMRLFNEITPSNGQEKQRDQEMEVDEGEDTESSKLINSTEVHEVNRLDNMIHEVVIPSGTSIPSLRMTNAVPAFRIEFDLDPFQQSAIQIVENDQSLLVAAHTSAGKTVIAQYAIAEAQRNSKYVIYTSPIKALSNQKYRELEEKFDGKNVGLMTGDVTLNPRASILVMTTEILRSMLYKKSDFFSQVAWVIFDEIHYMNNEERGVVWEESIILLPSHIRQLFLSATIPNAKQFAGWICSLKKAPVHIISTERRPIPLCHYVLPVGSEGMFEIVSQHGFFREDKHAEAMREMERGLEKERREKRKTIKDSTILSLVRTLAERDLLSAVAFSFSRAECEHYATAIKDLDMNTDEEKSKVRGMIEIAIDRLTDEDRKLSQIQNLIPLLERGTAVHHSGLLPVVKETIELLFSMGLVKMLFATETFAMGLNVPARAVVFTSARKFDGKRNRWLTASEYAQMAGRAGRRNSSFIGVSILMLDEQIKGSELRKIVKGALDPLTSRFRLSYNMLLNLLDRGEISPEELMDMTLRRYQNTTEVPELTKTIALKEVFLSRMPVPGQMNIERYMELENAISRIGATTKKMYMTLPYLMHFFNTGRLLKIKLGELDFGWGVLIRFERKTDPEAPDQWIYILEVMINVDAASARDFNSTGVLKPAGREGKSTWEVVPMTVNCIDEIAIARFFVPEDLKRTELKEKLGRLIHGFVHDRMAGSPSLLDPIKDMQVKNPALEDALRKMRFFEQDLAKHPLAGMKKGGRDEREQAEEMIKAYEEKSNAEQELKQLKLDLRKKKMDIRTGTELFRRKCNHLISQLCNTSQPRQFKRGFQEVLLKLGYIGEDHKLKKKGKIAACISTSDELLLTELIVSGELEKVSSNAELAALLSCFVCDESSGGRVSRELTEHHKLIQKYAGKLARIVNKTGQELVEGEYVDSFKPSLMEATKQWVKGVGFAALLKKTELYEGSIIRSLRRLEELLKEVSAAAGVAENEELQNRFDDIRTEIRRDIVFAASLYL
ncbi:hypothetical protein PENTCL1PPCAC_4613 [Pristionchus entomophagus]|uniref:Helicase n=1 Tax=Pristionchus entomophagus TaxID=358040 RepID=A0AAV5SP97_9BILA|nr:hypothetical protein PENTCL1PPCAC_4613 [Pristionchus entomophagus]